MDKFTQLHQHTISDKTMAYPKNQSMLLPTDQQLARALPKPRKIAYTTFTHIEQPRQPKDSSIKKLTTKPENPKNIFDKVIKHGMEKS